MDPKHYGVGGDLNLKPFGEDVGIYVGGRFANDKYWNVSGGLKWKF
jgi:hypothetical protein